MNSQIVHTEIQTQNPIATIRALLAKSVDYAGLFPPATLALDAAVKNYAAYKAGPHAWMLGRFVISAPRLQELANILPSARGDSPSWSISALVGQNFDEDLEHVQKFNHDVSNAVRVDSVEIAPVLHNQIEEITGVVPRDCRVYFEVPLNSSTDLLRTIAQKGARAKLRTGGVKPEAIPPTSEIASFIKNCVKAKACFKATAGLHHPIRSLRPLTYEPNAVTGEMHGFVNLLMACVFGRSGASGNLIMEILADRNPASFRFADSQAQWKRESVPLSMLQQMRKELFISFGSCSFQEPVEDLASLGWL